jgi:hypothetical protein
MEWVCCGFPRLFRRGRDHGRAEAPGPEAHVATTRQPTATPETETWSSPCPPPPRRTPDPVQAGGQHRHGDQGLPVTGGPTTSAAAAAQDSGSHLPQHDPNQGQIARGRAVPAGPCQLGTSHTFPRCRPNRFERCAHTTTWFACVSLRREWCCGLSSRFLSASGGWGVLLLLLLFNYYFARNQSTRTGLDESVLFSYSPTCPSSRSARSLSLHDTEDIERLLVDAEHGGGFRPSAQHPTASHEHEGVLLWTSPSASLAARRSCATTGSSQHHLCLRAAHLFESAAAQGLPVARTVAGGPRPSIWLTTSSSHRHLGRPMFSTHTEHECGARHGATNA